MEKLRFLQPLLILKDIREKDTKKYSMILESIGKYPITLGSRHCDEDEEYDYLEEYSRSLSIFIKSMENFGYVVDHYYDEENENWFNGEPGVDTLKILHPYFSWLDITYDFLKKEGGAIYEEFQSFYNQAYEETDQIIEVHTSHGSGEGIYIDNSNGGENGVVDGLIIQQHYDPIVDDNCWLEVLACFASFLCHIESKKEYFDSLVENENVSGRVLDVQSA